jgi:hypothetical protein
MKGVAGQWVGWGVLRGWGEVGGGWGGREVIDCYLIGKRWPREKLTMD